MTAVRLERISKVFGATQALRDVSLDIAAGELFFLLGPSGCGKSTLLRLIAGLHEPTGGRLFFNDRDVTDLSTEKRNAVMCFQSYALWPHMTVRENVRFGLDVRKVGRAAQQERRLAEVLRLVQMTPYARRKPNELSGGQQQRVALALALVGAPDLLLLDEPTVGLDVVARRAFRADLARRRDAGTAILLTTHVVEEAAAVADRVVVLDRGRVVAADTPAGLTARLPDRTITARTGLDDVALRALPGVVALHRDGGRVRIGTAEPERVLRHWLALDDGLADLRVEGAGLDDALLALTGAATAGSTSAVPA